jgi:hypothetical protein
MNDDDIRRMLGYNALDDFVRREQERFRELAQPKLASESAVERAMRDSGAFALERHSSALAFNDYAEALINARSYSSAADLARAAIDYDLSAQLEVYRPSELLLASQLDKVVRLDWWRDDYLEAFNSVSASARMIEGLQSPVSLGFVSGSAALRESTLQNIAQANSLLNAAGLAFPSWRLRLRSKSEKRSVYRARGTRPPKQVRAALSLMHQQEAALRAAIDDLMSLEYGEDWALSRLSMCGSKGLLGRHRKRGGPPLKYADFTDYANIVSHPDHFTAIFYVAFNTSDDASGMMLRLGQLRASALHGHEFEVEDFAELRLIWKAVEAGMARLEDDFD